MIAADDTFAVPIASLDAAWAPARRIRLVFAVEHGDIAFLDLLRRLLIARRSAFYAHAFLSMPRPFYARSRVRLLRCTYTIVTTRNRELALRIGFLTPP
jgi:hypothetical protein